VIAELCSEVPHVLNNELTYPPVAGQRVWDWFWELDKGRQVGMELNVLSWSDIAEWQRITGAQPEPWELTAIHRMERYRLDPNYDPTPPKPPEPVSIVKSFQAIKEAYDKEHKLNG